MRSLTRLALWPVALSLTVAALVAAFTPTFSGVQNAHAVEGDICRVDVGGPGGALALQDDPDVGGGDFDGQGNPVYVVSRGQTYGLVFRVEDGYWDNVQVAIDSETGSGRITSQAEIVAVEEFIRRGDDDGDQEDLGDAGTAELDDDPDTDSQDEIIGHLEFNVAHVLVVPSTLSQVVDVIVPETEDIDVLYQDHFHDSDGNEVDGIAGWLADVGYAPFAADLNDAVDICGNSYDDGWGFIDFECIEAGYFHINVQAPDDTEETGMSVKFFCGGQAETAEIKTQWSTLETQPTNVAPNGFGTSVITVTVWDQFGDRVDGVPVTLLTDNCTFTREGSSYLAPSTGGQTVDIISDTDPAPHDDQTFLINNPLEHSAGTAEAILDCTKPGSAPGVADLTAIIERPGADIVRSVQVTVVGPAVTAGLTLTLVPDDLECGETINATAEAVDAIGAPVSNGTEIFFTTDTSSGVVGGDEGAQGGIKSLDGKASALIATDPGNPGVHTVIAYILNAAGTPSAQTSASYTCEGAVAPAAPAAEAGTGSITPPNTGDAGLGSSHAAGLLVIAGAIIFSMAAVTRFRILRD